MARATPGEAVSAPRDGARSAWYAWKALHAASAQDPQSCFIGGYQRASRDAIAASVEFAGLVPLIARFLTVLEELAIDQAVARSAMEADDGEG